MEKDPEMTSPALHQTKLAQALPADNSKTYPLNSKAQAVAHTRTRTSFSPDSNRPGRDMHSSAERLWNPARSLFTRRAAIPRDTCSLGRACIMQTSKPVVAAAMGSEASPGAAAVVFIAPRGLILFFRGVRRLRRAAVRLLVRDLRRLEGVFGLPECRDFGGSVWLRDSLGRLKNYCV